MRLLLFIWLAASVYAAPPVNGPDPELQPPPIPQQQQQQVAQKRFGFASGDGGSMFDKIAHWLFPGQQQSPAPPARTIARSPYVHGPPPPSHSKPVYGPPPRLRGPPPPPQSSSLKCNPCNKIPWIPIPHGNYQDGGNVFAVVNAPQLLHQQGLHGGQQPSVPVYHHSPLPSGYLPNSNNEPEVIPSIPVADFISSIEYPANVVQSPIIDIANAGGHYKALDSTNHNIVIPEQIPQQTIINTNHENELNGVDINKEIVSEVTITPSVQTAIDLQQTPPPATIPPHIPTQQQPPLNQPPSPFHIPTYQQPPIYPATNEEFVPPHPQAPNYYNGFTAPGQVNSLVVPSAPGLAPPPLPVPVSSPGQNYRFEPYPQQNGWTGEQIPNTDIIHTVPTSSSFNTQGDNIESGFRNQWHNREINHQIQESRVQEEVINNTNTIIVTPKTPLKQILASDLRAALIAERERLSVNQKQQSTPNLVQLQHNIDQWTAQEFSNYLSDEQKLTTLATGTLAPSKHIPSAYFTTTGTYVTSTTVRPPVSPAELINNLFDHEPAASISHNIRSKTTTFDKREEKRQQFEPETTTTEDYSTITSTEEPNIITTFEPKRTTWEQALLGYSASTKEKVYVVTPMSTHQWINDVTTSKPYIKPKVTTEKPKPTTVKSTYNKEYTAINRARGAKQSVPVTEDPSIIKPRFTVRPTPAARGTLSSVSIQINSLNQQENRFYSVPTPPSYLESVTTTTEKVTTADKRSISIGLPSDLSTIPTVSPPEGLSVDIASRPSKVVTVISSSSSSSSAVPINSHKKPTRLSAKPNKESDLEIAAAVKEVTNYELKRKPIS